MSNKFDSSVHQAIFEFKSLSLDSNIVMPYGLCPRSNYVRLNKHSISFYTMRHQFNAPGRYSVFFNPEIHVSTFPYRVAAARKIQTRQMHPKALKKRAKKLLWRKLIMLES
ncbi:predicted protein [Botrytis cinerea T4]|uniref:Uncharacterized protein n=1 Tax=Botryotinia fuckeliana (strain T4) TaxID=999810 RepID=G2YG28_BOTF4|nr:predicted protein [Botrytis cinerea T4]